MARSTSRDEPAATAMRERAARHLFGQQLDAQETDAAVATALLGGHVTMAPHPAFELPARITWREDPFGDRNWRFNWHTLRWVDVLRRAGAASGSPEMLTRHKEVVRSWVRAHVLAPRPKVSPFAWNDMATGVRAIVLAGAIAQHGPKPWLLEALRRHGEVLAEPGFGAQRGNHALHVRIGLLVAGDVLERPDWTEQARDGIERLCVDSVDEEGVNAEGSVTYHAANLRWYDEALRHLRAAGLESEVVATRLARMPAFLAHATAPTGLVVPIGDSDLRPPVTFGDPAVTHARTLGRSGTAPAEVHRCFSAGYVFGRSSWDFTGADQVHYSLRHGPQRRGQIHGHHDGGSITLTVGATTVLHEGGRHRYAADPLSQHLKSSAAHNAVVLDEVPHDVDAATELLAAEHGERADWTLVRRSDGGGTAWTRGLYFSREHSYVVVVDLVAGPPRTPHALLWHVGDDAAISCEPHRATLEEGGLVTTLRWLGPDGLTGPTVHRGETDPHLGWRSEHYAAGRPAPVLRLHSPVAGATATLVTFASARLTTAGDPRLVSDLDGRLGVVAGGRELWWTVDALAGTLSDPING
jgi:hypothetical protein